MVYRGKLSKSCAECRAKKTRCDAAKPCCGQCRRADRKCSGYRDLTTLRFVDQSDEVSNKLSKKDYEARYPTPPSSEDEVSPPEQTPSRFLVHNVGIDTFNPASYWLEGNARTVFFHQYVRIIDGLKSELDFVPTVYGSASHGMLESIITALGLAALPQTARDCSLALFASQRYSSALRQTRKALQDSKLVRSDETLTTVLLLGLHELVAVDDPDRDSQRLSVHLQGALRLLHLRGTSSMGSSSPASRMFDRVSSQIMYSCLLNRKPIPRSLLRFCRSSRYTMHKEELAGADLLELAARLCDLLHNASEKKPRDPASTIEDLVKIDRGLQSWREGLSWRFGFEKVPIENACRSFLTHYDVYQNHIAGSVQNRYRCIRIVANEEIVGLYDKYVARSPDSETFISYRARVTTTIADMSQEICHAAPFFLGGGSLNTWQDDPDTVPPTMYGGASMLMPLYLAANQERVSPAMYQWLLQQIGRIGKGTGIAKARQILSEKTLG